MAHWTRRGAVYLVAIGCALGLVAFPQTTEAQGSLDPLAQIDRNAAEWLQSIEDGTAIVPIARRTAPSASATVHKMTSPYVCLPTCTENDGRFLSIAGENLQTLSGDEVVLRLAVPASETGFEIGIFDGDSSGTWDFASGSPVGVPLEYTLRADPDQDGGGPIVAQWSGATMLDNAWSNFTVSTGPEAATPSGNYFYLLTVNLSDISVLNEWSNFKVRTTGALSTAVSVTPVAFSFATPLFGSAEGFILYPNAATGDFTTTTYDGSWSFFVDAFESLQELSFWDGDFDRGSVGDTELDTDDPDTPNAPFLPPWAVGTAARPEGVAFVLQCSSESSQTGCPADDRSEAIFLRSPSIRYEVRGPGGALYANENPSGNREWEQFLISTTTSDPALADAFASELPPGVYEVRAEGVDISNLNAWRFFNAVLGVCEDGTPCGPVLRPYLVGDSVFFDLDGDGVLDAEEAGISGVEIELVDGSGAVLATATTDETGSYEIMVEAGTFTVRPADSSFEPGGALEGLIATNSPQQTGAVVDDNNLDFDFGFRGTGSIGDRVWLDANQNGQFDDGAGAGIDGVTLNLTGAGPDGVFDTADDVDTGSTVTDSDGLYSFGGLASGSYRVDVDETTLPGGYVLASGSDPAVVDLGPGEDDDTVDFGYFSPDQFFADVRPILECVSTNGDGTYTAFFGYLNENDAEVGIPVGSNNRFSPAPEDSGQPETFAPGRTEFWPNAAFSVDFDGNDLVWTLGDRTSTASASSTPCAYHVFLEKEWRDDKAAEVFGKTWGHHGGGGSSTDVRIEAVSEWGTAVCTVDEDSEELECDYDNDSPATDDDGLWVPVGTSYTVAETEQRDGWGATAGTGTFTIGPDGPDYCETGRDGLEKFCTHPVVNEPEEVSGPGTKGWIWWKHNPHQWPGTHIKVGYRIYSKHYARYIMRYASFHDVRFQLFREVVAAKLNRAVGNDSSCVDDVIREADYYLYYTLKTSGVWNRMDQLRRYLARYNAGHLCAPPRH